MTYEHNFVKAEEEMAEERLEKYYISIAPRDAGHKLKAHGGRISQDQENKDRLRPPRKGGRRMKSGAGVLRLPDKRDKK